MIRTEKLGVQYGNHIALRDVTLEVATGQVLAIVGPSGCGKSSFLAALNRMTDLIPGARVTGDVWLEGRDTRKAGMSPAALRLQVGMIFQKPNPFPMSIRRNLTLALREHGVRRRPALEETVERVLCEVGLWDEVKDRLDRSALTLSGGQQQRLCIARALALKPKVLLLDEPCSSLDPLSTERIERLMDRLRPDLATIIVTHNLAQARRVADQVAVFWQRDGRGQLLECNTTQRLFQDPSDPTVAEYLRGQRG